MRRLCVRLALLTSLAMVPAGTAAPYEPEAGPMPPTDGPDQSIEIAVGDLFTLYTGSGARVVISDESVVAKHQTDAVNIVIQGRKSGTATVFVWNRGRSLPRRLDVTVAPQRASIGHADIRDEWAESQSVAVSVRDQEWTDVPMATASLQDQSLVLYVGSVVTRHMGDVVRVVVGNESVIRASTLDDGSLLLLGLAAGVSELDVWTLDERHVKYVVRVYQTPPTDPLELINAILVEYPDVTAEERLGRIILRGTVDAARFEGFEKIVKGFANVITLATPELNVAVEDGIALDVTVLEINRNYQRNVGIRWQDTGAGPAVGLVGNLIPNRLFGVVSNVGSSQDLRDLLGAVGSGTQRLSGYMGISSILGSELQLLQEEGHARVLAAPSLSTVSGEVAKFLAGGDLPVAVLNEFGQPVVEFREFGIQLEIQPVADRNHNIRSRIRAEVSSVDFSVQVNGVPGLLRRQTLSTITARPGETIIISGLLDARDTRNVDKVPGLGSIPIIGALFRSDDFIQQRTELVVTVTPRIQRPNEAAPGHLVAAEAHLRNVLRGGERLNDQFLE